MPTYENLFLREATPPGSSIDGISSSARNVDFPDDPGEDEFGTGTGRRSGDAEGDGVADDATPVPSFTDPRVGGGGGGGGLFIPAFKSDEEEAE